MKQRFLVFIVIVSLFCLALILGCGEDPTPSLFDPEQPDGPTPVISELIPTGGAMAGVTEITIKGQNFSLNPEDILVFFDASRAELLSVSATELTVKAPKVVGDAVKVKIAVKGAELFSNTVNYKLEYAEIEYGGIDHFSDAYGVACDANENLYVSFGSSKVVKITPDQKQIDFVPSTEGFFVAMKMGPEGYLYAVRTRFMYRIPPEGGVAERYGERLSQPANDFDFDANKNIFIASRKTIYQMKADGTSPVAMDYPDITLNSLRVFDGYVYAAGVYTGTEDVPVKAGIWRNQILDAEGTLGATEVVYNWGEKAGEGGPNILAINFAADGDLYVGADAGDAITILHPNADGNYLNASSEALYPLVLLPPSTVMCWGSGQYLYVNRKHAENDLKRLMRVTTSKQGAPYYGLM